MKYKELTPTRSSAYQYKLLEVYWVTDQLNAVPSSGGISHHLNPFEYNEDIFDVQDELLEHISKLMKDNFTERQILVFNKYYVEGYTQSEIAKELGVNQSSIAKCLEGNVDYNNGKKVYGGISKKIKRIVAADAKTQELLTKLMELKDEKE